MEARITNAQVLSVGEYDLELNDGGRPRYVELYDPEARTPAEAVLRIGIGRDVEVPPLSMGLLIDVWAKVTPVQKVVRGEERDRVQASLKLTATGITLAKAASNGHKAEAPKVAPKVAAAA